MSEYKLDDGNAYMWLRGSSGGSIRSLNFQSPGLGPWVQQQVQPQLSNNHSPYQAMDAATFDIGGVDSLRQPFLNFQQPFQFPQQFCVNPLLQQQIIQQVHHEQIMNSQSQCMLDNQPNLTSNQLLQQPYGDQPKQKVQQQPTYPELFHVQNNNIEQQQMPIPSPSSQKSVFPDSSVNFSSVAAPSMQNLSAATYPESNANNLQFARPVQTMLSEQHQGKWDPQFAVPKGSSFGNTVLLQPFHGKDGTGESDVSAADTQNHSLFGINVGSSSLLGNAVPNLINANNNDNGVSNVPFTTSYLQNSLYHSLDESSGMLQHTYEIDPSIKTFVKVSVVRMFFPPCLIG